MKDLDNMNALDVMLLAKWHADCLRLLSFSDEEEKSRTLEAADLLEGLADQINGRGSMRHLEERLDKLGYKISSVNGQMISISQESGCRNRW